MARGQTIPAEEYTSSRGALVRSMTGFAQVRRETSAGELSVSLRSVNHRGLDLHFYLSPDFSIFENGIRALLKQQIGRGHVEIRVSLGREGLPGSCCNREVLNAYIGLFRRTAEEFQLESKPDLNTFLTLPGVIEQPRETVRVFDENFGKELLAAFEACLEQLNAYREREGRELAEALTKEVNGIRQCSARMDALRTEAADYFYRRLKSRLDVLLGDAALPESRLAEEAALLAERSDVTEELTRLSIHTSELERILEAGGDIGKRIDFLLQEMNRETNTVLSKTTGAGEVALEVSNIALSVKAHIERIREQALNLE
jgi:uncharacterized protein (TIGR00255 family)